MYYQNFTKQLCSKLYLLHNHTSFLGTLEITNDKYFAWFRDAPQKVTGLSKGNKGAAHEFTHYFYFPFRRPKGFDPRVGNLQEYQYYTSPTSQEIVARGTQLKNYFGLKEGEQLTPEMWNYAQKHYIADVADNNMRTFFKAGSNKSPNHPFFLQWLNRNAPAIGGVTTVGTTLSKNMNNQDE